MLDGSSFFTGKQNPVVPESLIQACLQVQGHDHTVQLAAGRAELYLQVHDGLVALNLLDALALLRSAVDRTTRFAVRGLTADEDRCRELAGSAWAPLPGAGRPLVGLHPGAAVVLALVTGCARRRRHGRRRGRYLDGAAATIVTDQTWTGSSA